MKKILEFDMSLPEFDFVQSRLKEQLDGGGKSRYSNGRIFE